MKFSVDRYFFSFSTLKTSSHCLLACIVSEIVLCIFYIYSLNVICILYFPHWMLLRFFPRPWLTCSWDVDFSVCVCVCARLCLKFIEFLGSVNLVFNKFGKSLDIIYIFFCSSSSRISSLLLDSNYTYIRPYIIFCYYSQFLRYGWIQPEISRCCCFQRVCSC